MLGRALSFAQPDILAAVRKDFVPVAVDDWYVRRNDDAEGRFFRKIADQGPKQAGNFDTRQGLYIATPDGKLLSYKNSGAFPEITRQLFSEGLGRWTEFADRVEPDEPESRDRIAIAPPPGGTVFGLRQRRLTRTEEGFCDGLPDKVGGDRATRDTLWLTEDETRSFVPKAGHAVRIPWDLASRFARFAAYDMTQGDGRPWPKESVVDATLTATFEADGATIRIDGSFSIDNRAKCRCTTALRGTGTWNAARQSFERFSIVMLSTWIRPGREPVTLGTVLVNPPSNEASDRLPPGGLKSPGAYWKNDR